MFEEKKMTEEKMTEEDKLTEEKKLYEEKKVADPFIAGFYESMAKTNTEREIVSTFPIIDLGV
jgi:predicted RNA-binding protein